LIKIFRCECRRLLCNKFFIGLLAVLLNNAGKVLTQRQLLNQVWGPNAVEHSHYLRIYMGHLRQKLEQDPARPRHFITETGIGYRFML
jgi:two-component system KDP operon response regulator KdpE